MGDYILVSYTASNDRFSILGSGTLDELLILKKSIDDLLIDVTLKAVEMPEGVTKQELASDNKLLEKHFGYLKDFVDTDKIAEVEQKVDYDNLGEGELF